MPFVTASASRSLSDSGTWRRGSTSGSDRYLALGKYVKARFGQRPRGTRRQPERLQHSNERFVDCLREIFFVVVRVLLPRCGVPELEVVHGSENHTVLRELGVVAV